MSPQQYINYLNIVTVMTAMNTSIYLVIDLVVDIVIDLVVDIVIDNFKLLQRGLKIRYNERQW